MAAWGCEVDVGVCWCLLVFAGVYWCLLQQLRHARADSAAVLAVGGQAGVGVLSSLSRPLPSFLPSFCAGLGLASSLLSFAVVEPLCTRLMFQVLILGVFVHC